MIVPSEIVDNFVAKLRDIPDLVTEMGGDPERIYAYHDGPSTSPNENCPGFSSTIFAPWRNPAGRSNTGQILSNIRQ